jgi:stage II sporulation protein M
MIGFFLPAPDSITQQIFKFIEDLILKTEGMNQFQITKFIFLNNLQSSFTSMIFGIPLGIFPLASTMLNGYLIGFVSAISVKTDGIFILWRLVPHGIFELPTLFISLGLGLKLGTFIFQKNKIQSLKKYFRKSLIVFFFVVFPLLILAAIIEGSLISSVG